MYQKLLHKPNKKKNFEIITCFTQKRGTSGLQLRCTTGNISLNKYKRPDEKQTDSKKKGNVYLDCEKIEKHIEKNTKNHVVERFSFL